MTPVNSSRNTSVEKCIMENQLLFMVYLRKFFYKVKVQQAKLAKLQIDPSLWSLKLRSSWTWLEVSTRVRDFLFKSC